MGAGVAAAFEGVGIVGLLAVIGQRLSRHLAAGDAAAVSEGGDEEGVDGGVLLEFVQHLFHAFIDEGDGAHLNADHLGVAAAGAAADPEGTPAVAAIALRIKLRRSIWIAIGGVRRPGGGLPFTVVSNCVGPS